MRGYQITQKFTQIVGSLRILFQLHIPRPVDNEDNYTAMFRIYGSPHLSRMVATKVLLPLHCSVKQNLDPQDKKDGTKGLLL